MPKGAPDLVKDRLRGVGSGDERPNGHWAGQIDGQVIAIRILSERFLDHHTFIETVPGEEFGYRFNRFVIDFNGELKPASVLSMLGHHHNSIVLVSPTLRREGRPLTSALR